MTTVGFRLGGVAVAALLVVAAAALPEAPATGSSHAPKARLFRCKEAPGGRCGIVKVPLDRARPSRGSIPIFFEYYRHTGRGPTDEAIVATLGGPGASATQESFFSDFFRDQVFRGLLRQRDLIFIDQRGVGRSRGINCRELQSRPDDLVAAVAACGRQLGSRAALYGTGDVARDIDAVRRALGIRTLDFYGGSYAGVDVQAYAIRFPQHLRSVVIDSPTALIGPYEFDVDTVRAVARAVRLFCERSRSCSREREDASESLAWLAQRLRDEPLEGVGYDASGRRRRVRVTEGFLAWRLLAGVEDGGFVAATEIGAAADALRAGDPAPLLRLAAEHQQPLIGVDPPLNFSEGHNAARYCTDESFPWDKGAPIETRVRQWFDAVDALPDDAFAPFSIGGWLAPFPDGFAGPDACIVWPDPKGRDDPATPADARFPRGVPALLLSGDVDSVTPTAGVRSIANAWPGSRFVEIQGAGHHTAVSFRFACAGRLVRHFIATLRVGRTGCARHPQLPSVPGLGRFPLTAGAARAAAVDRPARDDSIELDRKVAAIAAAAVTDAFRRAFLQSAPGRVRGLRGGSFSVHFTERAVSLGLRGVRFAEDVAVSGTARQGFSAEVIQAPLRVEGPGGEDGRLHVSGLYFSFLRPATVLRIRGTLGGRRLSLSVPAG